MSASKTVVSVIASPPTHWVGDGFPVSSVISPQSVGTDLSPFVLMDYGGPVDFQPTSKPRGVDSHPHRGFETVTLVFRGGLEHRDSAGHSGKIGPGDVQWMTAGSGVLHEERHSREFTSKGGAFEVAQLWVNLPAKNKKSPPGYQTLERDAIPVVTLPHGAGTVRVIAGELHGTKGAARTFTPVILWDGTLRSGAEAELPIPDGFNAAVFVRSGQVRVDGAALASRQLAVLSRDGVGVRVQAEGADEAHVIVLGGQPIDEPVIAYGPFVMNTQEEIAEAVQDFRSGRMGTLAS